MGRKKEKEKEKEFIPFAKVPESSIREALDKNRKYDSFIDESRRVVQFGQSIKVKCPGELKELAEEIIIENLKASKFEANINDLFVENILFTKNKNKNRIRIYKYRVSKHGVEFGFQAMTEGGEIRTMINLNRSYWKKNSKYVSLTFVQLFKRNDTFWGLQDAFRKRLMERQVKYRAALLFEQLDKKGMLKNKLPSWAKKILAKYRKMKQIPVN